MTAVPGRPQGSIHNAGLPWESVTETHQTPIQKPAFGRAGAIETTVKFDERPDVAIAAILGRRNSSATPPLVTMGCVMMRVCNLGYCPVGLPLQNPRLRKRSSHGQAGICRELYALHRPESEREYMARLGVRTVDELLDGPIF